MKIWDTAVEVIEQYNLDDAQQKAALKMVKDKYGGLPGTSNDTNASYTIAHNICAYMERTIQRRHGCSSTNKPF